MSIKSQYFDYLKHFEKTVTVKAFHGNPNELNMIALRHDVDYDIDLAMEMSFWEKQHNIRSTYYLLHTAPYFKDSQFIEKCLQIQDFGHEIGLHLNVLSEWMCGDTNDISARLSEIIIPMRKAGINISGISSHGDKLCYEKGFINYWCFSELKPENPSLSESGLSAEGIPVVDKKFRIQYPTKHQIMRDDDSIFKLWSVSMKELGLDYDASHLMQDKYFTDSGGGWKRSEDPLGCCLQQGRHQVLIHPIYWRGDKKIYFFLSTARSGSKWLANLLDKGTSVQAKHEFSLNHRYKKNELYEEKNTGAGFIGLLEDHDKIESLLIESRTYIESLKEDYAEANVYLERVLPFMKKVFPDASLVHLHRRPKDVVRSIMNREWYDIPDDNRHPKMEVEEWDALTPFEKCCWYVAQTNESLINNCDSRISFEKMVSDISYLTNTLKDLGIAVYPRLIHDEYGKKINSNCNYSFPEYRGWSLQNKIAFKVICNPIRTELGYRAISLLNDIKAYLANVIYSNRLAKRKIDASHECMKSEQVFSIDFKKNSHLSFGKKGCSYEINEEGIRIIPDGGQHAYFLLGDGEWHHLNNEKGWESKIAHYYKGTIEGKLGERDTFILYCLMYDEDGKLLEKKSLGQVRQETLPYTFSFKSRSDAKRFNIAVYMTANNLPEELHLFKIDLKALLMKNGDKK